MPTISRFFGIAIEMFWREHNPPHFHATYAEDEAVFEIESLDIIRGNFPSELGRWGRSGRSCTARHCWRTGSYAAN